MATRCKFVRPGGHTSRLPTSHWLTTAWLLAAILLPIPATADDLLMDMASSVQATAPIPPMPGVELNDASLRSARAMGAGPQMSRVSQQAGVILWDEPGVGRRDGHPNESSTSLTAIRYSKPGN